MTATHDPAPLAVAPEDVAAAVDGALDRAGRAWSRRVVWVPAAMAAVGTGVRVLPGPVLGRIADRM